MADFEAFLADVRRRLERGRDVFQDRSLDRRGPELLTEIQEELADVAGWSALLWVRLERLRHELRRIDPGPDHGTAVPATDDVLAHDLTAGASEARALARAWDGVTGDGIDRSPTALVGAERHDALAALAAVHSDPAREHAARIFGGRRT